MQAAALSTALHSTAATPLHALCRRLPPSFDSATFGTTRRSPVRSSLVGSSFLSGRAPLSGRLFSGGNHTAQTPHAAARKKNDGYTPSEAMLGGIKRNLQRILGSEARHPPPTSGAMGSSAAPTTSGGVLARHVADKAPSWDELAALVSGSGPGLTEERVAHAKERLFGSDEEPRLVFYRDNSSWCPYCERVWLQLEEKKIPHKVEKINMRCYGPKPAWYTQMVPSGLLPAVKIDGKLLTESLDIMFAIEQAFPTHTPLLPRPLDASDRRDLEGMLRQERQLMGAWLQLLTNPWGSQPAFEKALDNTNAILLKRGGPYFLGQNFSMIDAVYAPFLERIAASVPYWKGLAVRGSARWPAVDAWFYAMDARPAYLAMKSDDFGITHNLEPQIGNCKSWPEGAAYRQLVDGEGGAWDLPLGPETTAWGFDDGRQGRDEAAQSLVNNHEAIARFALRGVREYSGGGDAEAEAYERAMDVGLRYVASALLKGPESVSPLPEELPHQVAVAAAYVRDRVGVPRDLTYPAARQMRAHLQWLVRQMGSDL